MHDRQKTSLAGDDGLRQVREQGRARPNPLKLFRHAAKTSTARIGDFDRPQYQFLGRVAREAVRDAAEQMTHRAPPAAAHADEIDNRNPERGGEESAEACSYEAEVKAICGKYAAAIAAARRLNLPRDQIAAMVRALIERQRSELAAVRERRMAQAPRRTPK